MPVQGFLRPSNRASPSRFWVLGGLALAVSANCGAPFRTCRETRTCKYVPTDSGAGGDDNVAGAINDTGMTNGGTAGSSAGSAGSGAGLAGDGGAAGGGAPCDATRDPSTESCLIDDDYALFVAPGGKDSAAGTKKAPLATLSKAVELAADAKLILVCDGTFDEHVIIANGARIYGGFKCADWSPEEAAPLFKPTTAGPALRVDSTPQPLTFTRIDFEVGDAATSGETALTAVVNDSPSLTFDRVNLKAGKGKAGASGTLTTFTFPDPATLNGNAETTPGSGGASKTCNCQPTLASIGGLGGAPAAGGQSGSKGFPDLGGGGGGDPSLGDCSAGGGGKKGANAPSAIPGVGASTIGSATNSGWTPTNGSDGTIGSPGQAGGGGASLNSSGHGGGGGCGGCGGNGATGGKGGGGSIALLLIDSPVLLQASTLTTADAGDGGSGRTGQSGQPESGAGGGVASTFNSCPGGNGGKGGDGGASGGGAGGISVAVVWKGSIAPTLTDTTITTGKPGAAGIGGVPGSNDGVAGLRRDSLQAL